VSGFRCCVGTVLTATLLLATGGAAARADNASYDGAPRENVDTNPATVVTLFATVAGPVERVTVRLQTSAKYSDNLEIRLVHAGVTVTLYDGNGGDTSGAEINAAFADDAGGAYPTPGSVLGSVEPGPGSLASFIGREAAGPWELRIRNKYGTADDGTDLLLWNVTIRSGLAGPPVAVAVYDDGAYVDNVDDDGPTDAESTNVQASLVSLGHQVSRFDGISAARFSAGLAGKQVLVVPELEIGDLGAALDESAEGVIATFVAGGGTLVKMGSQPADISFLNEVFGYALSSGVATEPYALGSEAIGTRFQQGPGALPDVSATGAITGLPALARVVYQEFEGPGAIVSAVPFGSGQVIYLGWDWYDAAPRGVADGGWLDVLNRAVIGEARAISTRPVAVFADGDFVDLIDNREPGVAEAEAPNVQASLASLGHEVTPFAGTTLGRFQAALASARTLLIPELEVGDLAAALGTDVTDAIESFVAAGGVLIVHGDFDGFAQLLLNQIFGFSTLAGPELAGGQLVLEPMLTATRFEGGVTSLYENDGTLAMEGLPDSARTIYESPAGDVGVALIPYGAGKVIYLGWDWFDAAPRGMQDGGWRFVLDRAVLESPAPEPGAAALALAAVAALTALAERGRPGKRDTRWARGRRPAH
jgi:hypothetical protein